MPAERMRRASRSETHPIATRSICRSRAGVPTPTCRRLPAPVRSGPRPRRRGQNGAHRRPTQITYGRWTSSPRAASPQPSPKASRIPSWWSSSTSPTPACTKTPKGSTKPYSSCSPARSCSAGHDEQLTLVPSAEVRLSGGGVLDLGVSLPRSPAVPARSGYRCAARASQPRRTRRRRGHRRASSCPATRQTQTGRRGCRPRL